MIVSELLADGLAGELDWKEECANILSLLDNALALNLSPEEVQLALLFNYEYEQLLKGGVRRKRQGLAEKGPQVIGTFDVITPVLLFGDPCYEDPSWEEGDVRIGLWEAAVTIEDVPGWGVRNVSVMVYHESVRAVGGGISDWNLGETRNPGVIPVDSGKAGIYTKGCFTDKDAYGPNDNLWCIEADWGRVFAEDEHLWYAAACVATGSNELCAGMLKHGGVVSDSGIGDGSYTVVIYTKGTDVVAAKIVFLEEEEGNDADDDYDDWDDKDEDEDEEEV